MKLLLRPDSSLLALLVRSAMSIVAEELRPVAPASVAPLLDVLVCCYASSLALLGLSAMHIVAEISAPVARLLPLSSCCSDPTAPILRSVPRVLLAIIVTLFCL